ncbi:pentapeptide repeat-containing protein [Clostridium sp.]|uniref:pentapeptide repeat-containing protein n=1 Tax=Clostridium sp. TaxID=1506 RepID=UPI003217CCE3
MGRAKEKKKRKQELKRVRKTKMGKVVRFNLANSPVKYRGFKNKYNYQTNIHNLIYKDAIFENVRYHASNITECNFKNTKLLGVEFISTNLKGTSFKNSTLEEVIFFNCNFKNTDFDGVKFKNVIFISTNIDKVKSIKIDAECRILKTYPNIKLDNELENTLLKLSECNKIYRYHILHVKKSKTNNWNVSILLNYYGDKLQRALEALYRRKNKNDFYTIYAYRKMIDSYLQM